MADRSSLQPSTLELLRKRVKTAPDGPGVYRWLNKDGTILYVGKAKNLRKRLASYVAPAKGNVGPWKQSFLLQIADFDVTVTNTELEALILETNLIKELKPKYNVLMKDDKNYVYIRISKDTFPRIDVVRKIFHDGAKYFGPKTTAEEARQVLTMLRKIYPFRTCKMEIEVVTRGTGEAGGTGDSDDEPRRDDLPRRLNDNQNENPPLETQGPESIIVKDPGVQYEKPETATSVEGGNTRLSIEVICKHKDRKTPCLDYHIGQCSAPCTGARTPEQYYEESIQGVIDFLKGEEEPVKKLLKERMLQAAADKKFETAAQLRNHLQALERKDQSVELVSDTSGEDSDIIGTALLAGRAHVVILHRRGGKMIGEKSFALSGNPESEEEVISQFIAQFYDDDADIPPVIVAGTDIPERDVLEELLKTRRGYGVKIIIPERGKKSHLLMLAEKNAAEKARQAEAKWEADKRNTETALEELKDMLQLPALPVRIEGYDISHLGGTETVGSMVVMRNGKAANDQYRSFTIRTLRKGDIDDYWSLKEVLSRRLRRLSASIPEEEKQWEAQGVTFGKAKKAEQGLLEGIQSGHPEELTDDAGSYEDYTVARANGDIVAMAKLTEHSPLFMELTLVWVAEPWQGTRLGQFLIRKILKTVKKGKVYTAINPALENVYAELGFRYVIKPSRLMQEKLDKRQEAQPTASPLIVMMWEAVQNRIDPSFTARPDLIVIDGGKGQLSAVWDVLQNMQLMIPVIGLAKREEEVFVPGRSEPIVFAKDSPAKFLLMRLRDEAHRSANRHREGRGFKTMKASLLDEVPGIGDTTRNELMKKFKTISGIRAASDEDLKEFLSDSQLELLRVKLAEDAARNG